MRAWFPVGTEAVKPYSVSVRAWFPVGTEAVKPYSVSVCVCVSDEDGASSVRNCGSGLGVCAANSFYLLARQSLFHYAWMKKRAWKRQKLMHTPRAAKCLALRGKLPELPFTLSCWQP